MGTWSARYIDFIERYPSYVGFKKGKTKRWVVIAKGNSDDILGWIKWYFPWRCYIFEPATPFSGRLVFEKQCLRDVDQFLENRTNEFRKLWIVSKRRLGSLPR
jgi:hypothetical protein